MAAAAERARFLANAAISKMLEKQRSVAFCYYCRKKIRMEEAVIRDNIVMCQKCAESHLATENAKKK